MDIVEIIYKAYTEYMAEEENEKEFKAYVDIERKLLSTFSEKQLELYKKMEKSHILSEIESEKNVISYVMEFYKSLFNIKDINNL